jgi:hypothetical protein
MKSNKETRKMANLITGLFDTENAAENAVSQLKSFGYGQNEISIIMKDRTAARELAVETGSQTVNSAGSGALIGGTLGAVVAGILGIGSVVIPGVGVLVAGSVAAMLAGAGAGGIAGGLIGWLVGLGIPEDVALYYERGLGEGGVVVAVSAHPGDEARVRQVLHSGAVAYSGYNIPSYVAPSYASRYNDLTPPRTIGETNRDANSNSADARSDARTIAEHEREDRRALYRTNPVSGTAAAVENEVDRTKTALQNQGDKI